MPPFSPLRAAVVLATLSVLFLVLISRVIYVQTYGRQQTIRRAERQQHQNVTLPARRGSVFDRNGMMMAGTVQTRAVFVDPQFMLESFQADGRSLVQMDQAIEQLARLMDLDPFELSTLLGERPTARFIKLAEHMDEATCQAVAKLNIPGVGSLPLNVRSYPMGSLGAHVLGGVGKEGIGLEGLELKFEKLLAGKDGFMRTMKNARRQPIAAAAEDYLPPLHGQHLILSLDANIQMIAEQELADACTKFKARRGEVVVMDPYTGEVLALANWPAFNPQNLDDSTPDVRRNRCLTDPYEPGSTIKPFIVGPGVQERFGRLEEVLPIRGPTYVTRYGRRITDVHPYSELALWDVLVKSSNIGMCMLGERMGNGNLRGALAEFGFGRRCGIELPGEDPGLLNPIARWTKYSTHSVSQGYEIMVTPIQLARAFCAYANGGQLVRPTLLRGMLDADGTLRPFQRSSNDSPRQILDNSTAAALRRVMADVPVRGTGTKSRSASWNIFGKTGTAHVSEGRGGYSETRFTSSFIAAAPYESPRLVVAFIVHEADKRIAHYGGVVSAPGAGKLIERALAYLQVPASPDLPPPPPQIAAVLYAFNPKAYQNRAVASASR